VVGLFRADVTGGFEISPGDRKGCPYKARRQIQLRYQGLQGKNGAEQCAWKGTSPRVSVYMVTSGALSAYVKRECPCLRQWRDGRGAWLQRLLPWGMRCNSQSPSHLGLLVQHWPAFWTGAIRLGRIDDNIAARAAAAAKAAHWSLRSSFRCLVFLCETLSVRLHYLEIKKHDFYEYTFIKIEIYLLI